MKKETKRFWRALASRRELSAAANIARNCGVAAGVTWLFLRAARSQKLMKIRVSSHDILIRPLSPDAGVAIACLSGEFQEIFERVPRLRSGLIVDAGGYIGTAAIAFAEAYPEVTVLSLEPSSNNFKILCKNVAGYQNIIPLNKALAPHSDGAVLRNRGTGQWGYTIVQSPVDQISAPRVEEVDCITIDQIIDEYGRPGIGVLKLDIEGAEFELLKGSPDWVREVDAICAELHDRIVSGCSEAWTAAVAGRQNMRMNGEKFLSISTEGIRSFR